MRTWSNRWTYTLQQIAALDCVSIPKDQGIPVTAHDAAGNCPKPSSVQGDSDAMPIQAFARQPGVLGLGIDSLHSVLMLIAMKRGQLSVACGVVHFAGTTFPS